MKPSEFEQLAAHVARSWDGCGEGHAEQVAKGFESTFPSVGTAEQLMRHARRLRDA